MIPLGTRIWLAAGITDMRRGFDGLAAIVQEKLAADPFSRPDFILSDLRELHQPYPQARTKRDGSVTVGDATVRITGNDVVIVSTGHSQIDLLRAGARAIWDSGRAIYGLNVDERLSTDPFHRP